MANALIWGWMMHSLYHGCYA